MDEGRKAVKSAGRMQNLYLYQFAGVHPGRAWHVWFVSHEKHRLTQVHHFKYFLKIALVCGESNFHWKHQPEGPMDKGWLLLKDT
jgi:hypothetical protein